MEVRVLSVDDDPEAVQVKVIDLFGKAASSEVDYTDSDASFGMKFRVSDWLGCSFRLSMTSSPARCKHADEVSEWLEEYVISDSCHFDVVLMDDAWTDAPLLGSKKLLPWLFAKMEGCLAFCLFTQYEDHIYPFAKSTREAPYERDTRIWACHKEDTGYLSRLFSEVIAEKARRDEALAGRKSLKLGSIVGDSSCMKSIYDQIAQVAHSDTSVLVDGESGTGKELVAQAIHENSHRVGKPFVKVHCAALPETILESELFGHEKGSFTGAVARRKGRFEMANGGTIFLDEVGDFTPTIQVKMLRVLQEREFERLGGMETIKVDVRVVAATNRNLDEMIDTGEFRQDLYYRLNVFPIHLPPLRERRADILQLAEHFIDKYSRRSGHKLLRISKPAMDMLMAYHWPGNVRELENCIERAVLVSDNGVIREKDLPAAVGGERAMGPTFSMTCLGHQVREITVEKAKAALLRMEALWDRTGEYECLAPSAMNKKDLAKAAAFYLLFWHHCTSSANLPPDEFFGRFFKGANPHPTLRQRSLTAIFEGTTPKDVTQKDIQREIAPSFWKWCQSHGLEFPKRISSEVEGAKDRASGEASSQ